MGGIFDVDSLKNKLEDLSLKSNSIDLWENKKIAENILKDKISLKNTLDRYTNLQDSAKSFGELVKLAAEDAQLAVEIHRDLEQLIAEAEMFEVESLFRESDDGNNCFIEINEGVGGTDACDFSAMLLDMYMKWCRTNNFRTEVINLQSGDEAGIINAVVRVSGSNAFGWLRNESGVHRLVRMSPYNANGKRQTSFSSVWVYPICNSEDGINITIDENCLKIDTYRSSGAGGQHLNKTDSAVRITHIPTKITVQCQNQRSQHQNKEEAIKILKSKLYELEKQKLQKEKEIFDSKKTTIGWGHQVRNYILHPYQLVKDLRSGYQVNNFERMMNGEYLSDFIRSCIIAGR